MLTRHHHHPVAYPIGRCLLALLMVLAAALMTAPAAAQDMVQQLEAAHQAAQDNYDVLQLAEAERGLEEAISKAQRFSVDDPVVAKLHMMLGIVRFAVTRDEDAAYAQFVQALNIDRTATIDEDYQTPSLLAVYERALATVPEPQTPVITPDESSVKHTPVESANTGKPIRISVEVPEQIPLYRVVLNYRHYGERQYTSLEMAPSGPTAFSATIPGEEVRTSQIDYFIEVLNRTGEILVSASSPTSPFSVVIFGDDSNEIDDELKPDLERQYIFLQLGIGSGGGFATAEPVFHPQIEIDPGLAPSPLLAMVEVGFLITPSLHLSGFYRAQILERDDLGGGKLKWWFDNEGDWTLYTGVGGGYGRVRHTVDLGDATCDLPASGCGFVDTTREGPYHIGLAFGAAYNLSPNFAVVTDFYTMFLFPDISAHIDAVLALRASY
ncbi:MAG: hypothetical protein AAFX99_27190 [Myxococcota bacterium]